MCLFNERISYIYFPGAMPSNFGNSVEKYLLCAVARAWSFGWFCGVGGQLLLNIPPMPRDPGHKAGFCLGRRSQTPHFPLPLCQCQSQLKSAKEEVGYLAFLEVFQAKPQVFPCCFVVQETVLKPQHSWLARRCE